MSPRRGVLFDATGTLIEASEAVGEVYSRIAREHGVDLPAWRLDDGFRRVVRHAGPRGTEGEDESARREGEIEWWFEIIRQTFQATDSTARFADFRTFAGALYDAYRIPGAWRLRDGVAPLLERLSRRGLGLAVVSNFDHRLPEILEQLEIAHYFSSIEVPSRRGFAKPDPPFFAAAAEALETPLEALVYVGDEPKERLDRIEGLGLAIVDVNEHDHPHALDAAIEAALG